MNALHLDYQLSSRRMPPLALLALAAGCVMAILVTTQFSILQAKIAGRSAELDQTRAANEDHEQRATRLRGSKDQSAATYKAQSDVMTRLSLPWVPLFKSLENAQDQKVFLLAIEPNIKTRTLHLTAETDKLSRALAYLDRLRRQPALSEVTLTEHEIELDTPGQPVKFTLNIAWSARQ